MTAKFEIHEHDDGKVSFSLKAANGEVVAEGGDYRDLAAAKEGMYALKRAAVEANVPGDREGIDTPNDGIHMHF